MALKGVCTAILFTTLLLAGSPSVADEYRPDEFLGLDLSKAVLSPKPLGPATQFAPYPVEAKTDRASSGAQARVEPEADRKIVAVRKIVAPKVRTETRVATRVAHVRAEKPRGAARVKLARRHGNPLDAQASNTRIQVWPCRSGGICNWQR